MIKKSDKYTYVGGTRYMDNGSRNYDVAGYRLPSVTTILGRTKDDTYLKKWIADKGKKEAERIKNIKVGAVDLEVYSSCTVKALEML